MVFKGGVNHGVSLHGFIVFLSWRAGSLWALARTSFEASKLVTFGEGVTESISKIRTAAMAKSKLGVRLDFRPGCTILEHLLGDTTFVSRGEYSRVESLVAVVHPQPV